MDNSSTYLGKLYLILIFSKTGGKNFLLNTSGP